MTLLYVIASVFPISEIGCVVSAGCFRYPTYKKELRNKKQDSEASETMDQTITQST